MKTNFQSHRRIASVLLLSGIALGGCAGLATSPSSTLQQQIEGARTRADHEALVKHYTGEAATARAKAAEHRKLAASYLRMPMGGRGGTNMSAHCNAIANSFDSVASQYDGMVASHQQMAAEAKP